ncbi:hypothetical protein GCM10023075_08670 [Streptosporangium album]
MHDPIPLPGLPTRRSGDFTLPDHGADGLAPRRQANGPGGHPAFGVTPYGRVGKDRDDGRVGDVAVAHPS